MKLSVALAIHNEEKVIEKCLESIYELSHEIIVVDGKSTDQTVKLIKDFDKDKKIHIFHEENPAMFHINKQKAIEKCTGDWILQLDADEIVPSELAREIELVIKDENAFEAYEIPRLNFFLGRPLRKGGQYPDYTTRLYKKGKAKFPCVSVHEQVQIEGVTSVLKQDLHHYPYRTFGDYIKKWSRYARLEARLLYKLDTKPSIINFIKYMIVYPKWWFLKTYFRHKGFVDGFPGFVFSLFSSLRYWVTYIRLYELTRK